MFWHRETPLVLLSRSIALVRNSLPCLLDGNGDQSGIGGKRQQELAIGNRKSFPLRAVEKSLESVDGELESVYRFLVGVNNLFLFRDELFQLLISRECGGVCSLPGR